MSWFYGGPLVGLDPSSIVQWVSFSGLKDWERQGGYMQKQSDISMQLHHATIVETVRSSERKFE
jgi:hypothetical protein